MNNNNTMQPNQTITIDLVEWEKAQGELQRLRQQNLMLKAQLKQLHPIVPIGSPLIRNRYSMTQSHFQLPSNQTKVENDSKSSFKSEMQQWAHNIDSKFKIKNQNLTLGKIDQDVQQHLFRGSSKSIQIKQPMELQQKQGDKIKDLEKQSSQNLQVKDLIVSKIKLTSSKSIQFKSSTDAPEKEKENNSLSIQKKNLTISKLNIQRAGSFQINQSAGTQQNNTDRLKNSQKEGKNEQKKDLRLSKKKIRDSLKQLKELKLIQSICVFGPDDKSLLNQINNKKMHIGNKLIYSSSEEAKQTFKVYGEYFYPQGLITVRNIQEQQAPTQINQIIFRKNTKKQDCSLFLFRGDEANQRLKIQNVILQKVNPGRWLSAFFVQFSDFQIIQIEEPVQVFEQKKLNKSVDLSLPANLLIEDNQGQGSDRGRTENKTKTHYLRSKYTLCIFTYFPLINVMQQILSSILDEIKIRRVEKYAQNNEMKNVSIQFLINSLRSVGQQIQNQVQKIPITYSQQIQITFGNFQIMFPMSQTKMDQLLLSGWVHDIIKTFDKEVLYDLYTNMMIEESLCFVCENLHLLTYIIFFFVCILPHPFTYPHPCISQVFNLQLLQSPFIITAGINQTTKWLEQCVTNYPKKIFIDLNDEAKIKGKKKLKNVKSQRLKKIFNNLYRKIQTNISPMPQIFKKKATIIRPASKQQNQSVLYFIKSLQTYYAQEIFSHLPNPAIITFIRDKTVDTNQTSIIFSLLKEIQKYLKESRKQKQKDQFIDLLIQQQIFYVHMGIRYGLD